LKRDVFILIDDREKTPLVFPPYLTAHQKPRSPESYSRSGT
jgi:hypothetical protein